MVTAKNKCSLCDKSDLLLKYDSISTQIQKSFFSINKNLFSKNDAADLQLCVTCTYQVELSSEIVREYNEMCNRNNIPSNKKCFFCEDKANHLISLDENPNEALQKINVFLNAVNIKRDYNDLKACIRCLYNLHIWTDLRKRLFKKTHILEADTVTNNNGRRAVKSSPADATNSKSSPKVNTRKSLNVKSQKNVQIQHESISSTSSDDLTNNNIKKSSSPIAGGSRRTTRNKKSNWHNYLKDKLKNFETVDELIQKGNFNLTDSKIKNDPKLFKNHPFVNIPIDSQISNARTLEKTQADSVIVISDSEETQSVQSRPTTRRLNLSLKKSTPSKPKSKKKPKKLKLKFSFKSTPTKQKSLPSTSKDAESPARISESSESIKEISSGDDENEELMCNVCDKNFTVKCDYLAHKLKHEKMEDVVVNVTRHRLPEQMNVAQLSPKKQLRKVLTSPEIINRLLSKWIGDHAVQTFEDLNENEASEKTVEKREEKPVEDRVGNNDEMAVESVEEDVPQKEIDSSASVNDEVTQENVESESMVMSRDEDLQGGDDIVKSSEDTTEKENGIEDNKEAEERNEKDQIEEIGDEVNVEDKIEEEGSKEESTDEMNEMMDKNEDKIEENHSKKGSTDEINETVDENGDKIEKNDSKKGSTDEMNEIVDKNEDKIEKNDSKERSTDEMNEIVDRNEDKIEKKDSKEGSTDEMNEIVDKIEQEVSADETNEIVEEKSDPIDDNAADNEITSSDQPTQKTEDVDVIVEKLDDESPKNEKQAINDQSKEGKNSDDESENRKTEDTNAETDSKTIQNGEDAPREIVANEEEIVNTVEVSEPREESTEDRAKTDKPEQIDEFSNSEYVSPPVMTCEDLLNILENIDSETESSAESSPKESKKRKRTVDEDEPTPKRKKVRFAEEKEVFSANATETQMEKLVVNDQVIELNDDCDETINIEIDD